jgi:hypothetical protein
MSVIQTRIEDVKEAKRTLLEHPCCFKLKETKDYYIVIHPDGYFPNGCRAGKDMGKAKALRVLERQCEKVWLESLSFCEWAQIKLKELKNV